MNFGSLRPAAAGGAAAATTRFRIAVLGDFSARANHGELKTGADLAKRKSMRIDVDNFDDILARCKLRLHLPIGADGGCVEVPLNSLDDFHPDQLYENVELFSELSGLRQRLKNKSTFAAAAKEIQAWLGEGTGEASAARPEPARGSVVPRGKMSDFAKLVGRPAVADASATAVEELLKQIVGPHVVAAKDPQQDKLIATVDAALSETMRNVLHHPDFQSIESLWRSVDMLVRRIETDNNLQIVLIDITAEELAADLSLSDNLQESGLYQLLVEQPSLDAQQGPYGAILANFTFEQTPPHADLLGRAAKIATAAKAPFLAGITTDVIKKLKPEDIHPLVTESWSALRQLPESAYLSLVVPRFLLRWPYGKKTEPISPFVFEEFTRQSGVSGMLWANGAVIPALLLGVGVAENGLKGLKLGDIMTVDDLPYYYYVDADGDQIALPCTDRLLTENLCMHVTSQGFMPLLALKGRAEVRLGSFNSLAGKPLLGPWSSETVTPSAMKASTSSAPPAAEKPTEAAPAASGDAELDALMASLGGGGDTPPAAAAPAEAADAELDALLASLGGDSTPAPAAAGGEEAMDPDLAALLADLG